MFFSRPSVRSCPEEHTTRQTLRAQHSILLTRPPCGLCGGGGTHFFILRFLTVSTAFGSAPASRAKMAQSFKAGFGFRVLGFGFRVLSFGFRASGFKFWVSGFEFWISDFGFRVLDSRFRVSISLFGFRVFCFLFSVFGFRVLGFGFRAWCLFLRF